MRAVSTTLTSSEIDDEVLRMFALVADGIVRATAAFVEGDDVAARQLVADDLLVNALQHRIESSVEQRLTSGDAIAPHEARALIAVLRIVPELERTGDLVEHIALRTPRGMAAGLTPQCRSLVAEMGQIAAAMWLLAAEAYAHGRSVGGRAAAPARRRTRRPARLAHGAARRGATSRSRSPSRWGSSLASTSAWATTR